MAVPFGQSTRHKHRHEAGRAGWGGSITRGALNATSGDSMQLLKTSEQETDPIR